MTPKEQETINYILDIPAVTLNLKGRLREEVRSEVIVQY
jgi:hypothetical protein